VNFKFLPEDLFLDRGLHVALLVLHVSSLVWILGRMSASVPRLYKSGRSMQNKSDDPLNHRPGTIVGIMFVSNFIGIVFARSLHYQFYVWYFHTLPYLLFVARWKVWARVLFMVLVEICWNVYPATALSSGLLTLCHVSLLATLTSGRVP